MDLTAGLRRGRGERAGAAGLTERLEALEEAVEHGRGRLDDALVDRAVAVAERARARLGLAGEHTVAALAGATGSGKSSLFNALVGADVSRTGVLRPTSSRSTAAAWGEADDVLAWLDVPQRHQVPEDDRGSRLHGLVLIDLPDHDSTEVAHHVEVDRLVEVVDLLVFVLDPQKYADAAIHRRYLAPLHTHRDVMLVVLNHVDTVPVEQRGEVDRDLARLLDADGLTGVARLQTSARTGEGVADLRDVLAERVGATRAKVERLSADVAAVAADLRDAHGSAGIAGKDGDVVGSGDRAELVEALCQAAGVPTVERSVEKSMLRRGAMRTGWPLLAWRAKLRLDPLRRLHLAGPGGSRSETGPDRTSLPAAGRVERARVDTALRRVADVAGGDLAPAWRRAVRDASTSRSADLEDALDRAVAGTDLGVDDVPLWWRVARFLQLVLAGAALAGALWLLAIALVGFLQVVLPEPPEQYGVPLPTLLLVAGLAGGWALAVLSRVVNGWVARRRARRARKRLRAAVEEVAEELVLAPVARELTAYHAVGRALTTASR